MTKLLEIRELVKNFYGKYENFIVPVLKFILGLMTFLTINSKIGFMEKFAKFPIALILALLSSFLPTNFMVLAAAAICLLHLYALSLEATAVVGIVFVVLFLLYFRFSPKDSLVVILLPLAFNLKIPCAVTLAAGLLGGPGTAVSVGCGVIVYYSLDFVASLSKTADSGLNVSEMATKFKSVIDGIVGNKGMIVAVVAFSLATLAVYVVRRMNIDHAWIIAMILFVGDLALTTQVPVLGTILGTVIGLAIAFVIKFFVFNLDYARTEKVQFEDDEYYYFVKAVPKVTLVSSDKKVKKVRTAGGPAKKAPAQKPAQRESRD